MKTINTEIDSFFSFLKFERRLSEHSLVSYETDLKQYLTYCVSNNLAFEKQNSVRTWIMSLVDVQNKSTSVNRKISTLNTYFKFLLSKNIIKKSPMENIALLSKPKNIPHFILDEKMQDLLDHYEQEEASNFEMAREHLMLELLYGTGMRLSELINIKIDSYDKYNKVIRVLGKGNKERLVPVYQTLHEKLIRYIESFCGPEQIYLLVTDKKKKLYPKFVYRIVNKALSKVSTQRKRSPHVLRHSFATEMLNNGAQLNTIKDILGHTNLAATQIYTHNSIERLKKTYKEAFKKINNEK